MATDLNELLIFDFDGVLVDSKRETRLCAYCCVTGTILESEAALPSGFVKAIELQRNELYAPAELVRFTEWWLAGEAKGEVTEGYKASDGKNSKALSERFFAYRKRLMADYGSEWYALHDAYEPLCSALRRYEGEPFPLLTNKNREAVEALLSYFSVPFNSKTIFALEESGSKSDRFKRLRALYPDRSYLMIDDNWHNLQELHRGGVAKSALFLAAWGYNGIEEQQQALALGYGVGTQEDVVGRLN